MSKHESFVAGDDCIGKTIARAVESYDDTIGFVFTDGTFTRIRALPGWEGSVDIEFCGDVSIGWLETAGIISTEKYEMLKAREAAMRAKQREAEERDMLSKLLKKYSQSEGGQ